MGIAIINLRVPFWDGLHHLFKVFFGGGLRFLLYPHGMFEGFFRWLFSGPFFSWLFSPKHLLYSHCWFAVSWFSHPHSLFEEFSSCGW